MAAGQQIALEPALAEMLAQDLHDAAIGGHVIIGRQDLGGREAVGHIEERREPIRRRLVRPHHAEVSRLGVEAHDVAQELARETRRLGAHRAGLGHGHRIVAEVGHRQVAQEQAAIGAGVGAHAAVAFGRERRELGRQPAALVEQLLGPVAAHPLLEHPEMLGIAPDLRDRHLMRPERALDLAAVDHFRAGPAFGRLQDDHRPARPAAEALGARLRLDGPDLVQDLLQGLGHQAMHCLRVVAGDDVGLVAVAGEKLLELLVTDAGQHRGVSDLVTVEVQDRQNGAVGGGVEELVGVPAGGQGAGLGLAVADHAADEEVRIVEGGAIGVEQRVAELAALVDRARRLGRHMARDAAGERELGEEPLHARLGLRDVRVDLAVGAL